MAATTDSCGRRDRRRRPKVPTHFRNRTENIRSMKMVGSNLTSIFRISIESGTSSRMRKSRNIRKINHATSNLAARKSLRKKLSSRERLKLNVKAVVNQSCIGLVVSCLGLESSRNLLLQLIVFFPTNAVKVLDSAVHYS